MEIGNFVFNETKIKGVYIIERDTAEAPSHDDADWGDNIYSNGAFEKTVTDGYKVLWFKVKDTENRRQYKV